MNRINVPQRKAEFNAIASYSLLADSTHKERLLTRYDVDPVIEKLSFAVFDEFLERNPEFMTYQYKETWKVGHAIRLALENTFLVCVSEFG